MKLRPAPTRDVTRHFRDRVVHYGNLLKCVGVLSHGSAFAPTFHARATVIVGANRPAVDVGECSRGVEVADGRIEALEEQDRSARAAGGPCLVSPRPVSVFLYDPDCSARFGAFPRPPGSAYQRVHKGKIGRFVHEWLAPRVNLQFSIMIGLVFGLLAGASAFVIAYSEYKRNWAFTGNATYQALRTAGVTFALFFLAALLFPWILRLAVARN